MEREEKREEGHATQLLNLRVYNLRFSNGKEFENGDAGLTCVFPEERIESVSSFNFMLGPIFLINWS